MQTFACLDWLLDQLSLVLCLYSQPRQDKWRIAKSLTEKGPACSFVMEGSQEGLGFLGSSRVIKDRLEGILPVIDPWYFRQWSAALRRLCSCERQSGSSLASYQALEGAADGVAELKRKHLFSSA